MNKELEKRLIDEFPTFFKDMYGDPRVTCMAWGCAHGDGWWDIIYEACKEIAKIDDGTFTFLQIKEKFGGLRLYYGGGVEGVNKIITDAEDKSYTTCEDCGTKENVTSEGSWIQTLCGNCRKPNTTK